MLMLYIINIAEKVYATSVVERKYAQYRMNSEFVMNHNKGKHSYTLKVNEFADVS